jgi:RNA polymerase sigma factor (TIGR02999 family)
MFFEYPRFEGLPELHSLQLFNLHTQTRGQERHSHAILPSKRIVAGITERRVGFMAGPPSQTVTQLLVAWSQGEQAALEKLVPLVYAELRRVAHRYMGRERPGHTLQTTALVNEAYLRLIDSSEVRWQDRAHFFAVSAQLMRRILVDFARSRRYLKRGGGAQKISFDEALIASPERGRDLVALDDAMLALASTDARKSQVVELRFFGGLSVKETAEVLKVSPDTVLRDWSLAKAWLSREMQTAVTSGQ